MSRTPRRVSGIAVLVGVGIATIAVGVGVGTGVVRSVVGVTGTTGMGAMIMGVAVGTTVLFTTMLFVGVGSSRGAGLGWGYRWAAM